MTSKDRAITPAWICWSALLLTAGGASGCQADFSPVEPVLGSIVYEWQAPVPSSGAQVPLPDIGTVVVPPGAVPAGTTLTLRIVEGVSKAYPPGWPFQPSAGRALQIVPESAAFAQPLLLTSAGRQSVVAPGFPDGAIEHLFRGDANDATWTWSADTPAPQPPGGGMVTWTLDRPGLWVKSDAPAPILDGTYHLTGLSCSSKATATPAGVYLVVAGGRFTLTATPAPGCRDEGTLAILPGSYTLTTGTRAVTFDARVDGTRLLLKVMGSFLGFCSAEDSLILLFDFKGCSTDADCGGAGGCNSQLCGPLSTTSATSCLTDLVGASGGK